MSLCRKRVSDETSGNLLGPEYVLRAAQALLYLLEDETVRPLLASAHQQLHLAAQSLRCVSSLKSPFHDAYCA